MSTPEPITGKVARILTTRDLVINRGTADGVEVGMEFDVLDPKGEDIEDPDSGDVLGSIPRTKVTVRVTQAQPRLSVARTFRYKEVNIGGMGGLDFSSVGRVFQPPKYVKRYETLRTDEQTWEDLPEEKSFVKVGDPVTQHVRRAKASAELPAAAAPDEQGEPVIAEPTVEEPTVEAPTVAEPQVEEPPPPE